jgi:hypothetical protein
MSDTVQLPSQQYRLLVAVRYLNASQSLYEGMKRQCGVNNFHFLVTLRSFIEYNRRGFWFLAWASEKQLEAAETLTFDRSGSPSLVRMDEMVNQALGLGKVSHLLTRPKGINEPFLNCLHALTHGNPISVRMVGIGLEKIFDTEKLLARAELEQHLFAILLYRRSLGEELTSIWKILAPICNRPDEMRANAKIAAFQLEKMGGLHKIIAGKNH